jgi:hypothetical protein
MAIMTGRARAAKDAYELALSQAWHGEVFARQKKLKNLSDYLPREKDAEPVAPELVLDAMLTLQSAGVPLVIRKVESGEAPQE